MRGNVPIPEIPHGEDVWLMVLVTSVRERRTQQGRLFCDASARNATGSIGLKKRSHVVWVMLWGSAVGPERPVRGQIRVLQRADPLGHRAVEGPDLFDIHISDFSQRLAAMTC